MGSTNHVITPQGEIYYMVGFLIPQLSPNVTNLAIAIARMTTIM